MNRRNTTNTLRFLAPLLLGLTATATTGCDYLKEKADEKLREELKKDSQKRLDEAEEEEKAEKKKGADKSDKASSASDGPVWVDASGEKTKLTRVKIDGGGLAGLSMLAPEGAKTKPSLGGRGVDVADFGKGFAVWVTEDPTVTLPLMKEAAAAKFGKESKIEHEDQNSIIVGGKSALGDAFFAYQGFFKANGKIYRCETEAAMAGSTKAHAEAIDKLCESLELDGKPIGGGATPPSEEKVAEVAEEKPVEAPSQAEPAAANTPAKASTGTQKVASTPAQPPAAQPPAAAQPAAPPAAPPAAAPEKKKTAAKTTCKCAKNDLQCNMRCSAR